LRDKTIGRFIDMSGVANVRQNSTLGIVIKTVQSVLTKQHGKRILKWRERWLDGCWNVNDKGARHVVIVNTGRLTVGVV